MNKILTSFNLFIFFVALFIGAIMHLMYGHCQTSKYHYIVQAHYNTGNLLRKNYMKEIEGYTGLWVEWYKSGAKWVEFEIKDGKANGKAIFWYESGAKWNEIEYKDGKMNGKYIGWLENGSKKLECEYKEDKKNGKYIEWDTTGKKIVEQEFKDGEMIKDLLAPAKE